ncbi:MAG: hypothetical protein QOJ26_179 [Thermoplasmata archaeon]|nr:hypothetical protein [Thermoplasmata archaeon]
MHRALVLVLAVLALPSAAAAVDGFQGQADVAPGSRFTWPIEGAQGDSLTLQWGSDVGVDVFVLHSDNASALDGNATPEAAAQTLNATAGSSRVTLPSAGPWVLVIDNTDRPAGGAEGLSSAHVEVSVAPYILEVQPPSGQPSGQTGNGRSASGEAPTLWNTLMFDAHHWDTDSPIEFASVGLWMVLLLIVACIGFASPPRLLAVLTASVAAFVTLWALIPYVGALTEIGPPALAGLAVAWFAVKRTSHARDTLQLAFVAAVLGAFAGVLLAFALKHLWSDPGTLYLGGRRFTDVLFTLPGFAVAGVVMFKVIPDIVHAIDEANADERRDTTSVPGQGTMFEVTCLRCQTEIKVDRSMKRFRVATDRFEFACPNCQYWMEWADPHAKGAAAA